DLEFHFTYATRVSKDNRGLRYKRVRKLLNNRFISNVADLYDLTAERLVQLERFGDQSAQQLVAAIAASKDRPLSSLLFALGIRHVGKTVAQLLARRFGTMDALRQASEEEINDVPGVGGAIAEAVVRFFAEESNLELVRRLKQAGLEFSEPRAAQAGGTLKGKTY